LDLQEKLNEENSKGFVLLVDIEKAYDNVDRDYLEECISTFNFGPFFCKWVHILHANSEGRIIMNGFLSKPFEIKYGVRLGCPWAPILFVCALEPLACSIRESTIKGIKLNESCSLRYKGYVDDTTCYLNSLEEINTITELFQNFRE
jgi:hypothetical protein